MVHPLTLMLRGHLLVRGTFSVPGSKATFHIICHGFLSAGTSIIYDPEILSVMASQYVLFFVTTFIILFYK